MTRRDIYCELLDKLSRYVYVAYAYGECILGYIAFYANTIDKAYISLIAVNLQYQKQHIGSYLLGDCEKIVRNKSISKIQLEVKKG